ncbi:MAG TPA: leucyl aminopeptidase [Glaciihabitans sp.]|jgi:leucyl aminopeptidase|nr:leucyl aminopeptidase [Glaciihabitans sp.]
MTVPVLQISSESPAAIDCDVVVVGVQKTEGGAKILATDEAFTALESSLASIGITGGVDELRRLPAVNGSAKSIALIGVGSSITPEDLRYAAGSAARQLRGIDSLVLALPAETEADVLAILEGAAIGAYGYSEHRVSSLAATKNPATTITVVSTIGPVEALPARASITAAAIHTVRDLVNAPPSHLYPETFAQAAVDLGRELPVEVDVLAEAELAAGGFGGILAVGLGSSRGPRMVKVTYAPAGATKHIALVGKGITFDSGGLSLKPPTSMIGMKYDMTGAATVLAVALAAAELELNVKVTAWLCIAENMPSGRAARPNDVLSIRGGKTVEVLNTDAEGRLVMADGIVAAGEEEPDMIIDVATLTGAQMVALGNRYGAAMGDDALVAQIVATATRVGETLWPMPLPAYLRPLLNSDVADIANIKPGNTAGGMLLAGVFLQDFVGSTGEGDNKTKIPWAHLDIAGPAENSGGGYGYTTHGPTGVTVRALLALAEEISLA